MNYLLYTQDFIYNCEQPEQLGVLSYVICVLAGRVGEMGIALLPVETENVQ